MLVNLRKEVGKVISKVCCEDRRNYENRGSNIARPYAHICIDSPKEVCQKWQEGSRGKRNLMLFDRRPKYRERYSRHFGVRGYYCETIGNSNEVTITQYIEEQYERLTERRAC